MEGVGNHSTGFKLPGPGPGVLIASAHQTKKRGGVVHRFVEEGEIKMLGNGRFVGAGHLPIGDGEQHGPAARNARKTRLRVEVAEESFREGGGVGAGRKGRAWLYPARARHTHWH